MNRRLRADRSTETPMDFEFTSRPSTNTKPVWAADGSEPHTPKKRPFPQPNPATPVFPGTPSTPTWPTFSQNVNVPFLFQEPPPSSPHPPAWVPPVGYSPAKAFPQPEVKDVDMSDVSPAGPSAASPEKDGDGERAVALGGLRRVFKSRQRAREQSVLRRGRSRVRDDDTAGEETDEEEGSYGVVHRKTSNHYTLNMPGPSAPKSELPYLMLGYLQVIFNGTLALVALYLLILFIITVQRDVEHRVAEESMDVVQEIAQCATLYKTNLCANNAIPAMVHQCASWETCMNRDPTKIGRAKISVEVVAEVVNSFVEPISWKTLGFILTSLSFLTLFINQIFWTFRAKTNPATHPPVIPQPFPVAPYPGPHAYLPAPQDWNKTWKHPEDDDEAARRRRRLDSQGQVAKVK